LRALNSIAVMSLFQWSSEEVAESMWSEEKRWDFPRGTWSFENRPCHWQSSFRTTTSLFQVSW